MSEACVIATGRYSEREAILASGLAPVGTSVGAPRFRLGYELAANLGMVAPYGLLDVGERDEFARGYRRRLERFGPLKIARVLAAIAAAHDAPGVVLLCFEDLSKPGVWCHRTLFADWWREQTGRPVAELPLERPRA